MTISDECLNRLLLQGSRGLDQPVWRDRQTRGDRGRRKERSRHKHNCPLVSWEDWHLILWTVVASHGTKGKRKIVKVMVSSDHRCVCGMDFISSCPHITMGGGCFHSHKEKKKERPSILVVGAGPAVVLQTETSTGTDRKD